MAKQATQHSQEPTAPAVHVQSKAKFVTVASKLPMHLEIQLCSPQTKSVAGRYGPADETTFAKTGQVYLILGTGYPRGQAPKGFPRRPDVIEDVGGGYALTPNIPADVMAAWMEQNKDTEMVRNGIIKVQADLASLEADAAEHAKLDSGLGPLNPDGDRRTPKPINGSVSPIRPEPRASA